LIEDYAIWDVVSTPQSRAASPTIESRYRISFGMPLFCKLPGFFRATVLYSEDLAEGQNYGSVRVSNPVALKV